VSGVTEELSELLGRKADVIAAPLLRDEASATALADAVAV
jgi:predicted nucleotidyltransferase